MEIEKVLIDVGSSSIKVYILSGGKPVLVDMRSIAFRKNFSDGEISSEDEEELVVFLEEIGEKYLEFNIEIYATAVFRKLSEESRKKLVDDVLKKTGFDFNIISHEEENYYLERALLGKCDFGEPVLLINVGGGSTELVVVCDSDVLERKSVDIGVGTLLKEFKGVNDEVSSVDKKLIIDYVLSHLPELESDVSKAFYTGGELNYMRLADYPLVVNDFFEDVDHPSVVNFDDFSLRNDEIFSDVGLSQLEEMMPNSPKWMHGARACSALAEAICGKYGVEWIVPSDSNLIDGVCRED